MKILVTGGAGFIGSHLVDALIKKNHPVIVVDDLSTGKKENLNPRAKFYRLKIQDPKLKSIFQKEKLRAVYHLAAQMNVRKSIADPVFDANANIVGSLNLLENCVKFKIKKFIFISTGGAIYGGDDVKIPTPETAPETPISPYGVAKLAIEKYLHYYSHQYKLPCAVLRLANIYGPRQNAQGEAGVVAIFCRNVKNKKPLTMFGGKQTRDFVYVADVISACLKVLPRNQQGIFNVGTGQATSIDQLARLIQTVSRIKTNLIKKPYINGEQFQSCLNNTKIKRALGWKNSTSLQQGLVQTWNYFNEFNS